MEELILEAYHTAATKEFFAITTQVERLWLRELSIQRRCCRNMLYMV
jgi:DNA-directed RNA polymerase subunit N (RpoN/RPB10)